MGRSLRFRVYVQQLVALLRLAFASAPCLPLNLATARNSLVHSSIGTPSLSLRLLVDIRFQVLFHSPPGVLFTFPSRYYALSVANQCLALEVVPPASRRIPRAPRYSGSRPRRSAFRLHDYHMLWCIFPDTSARPDFDYAGPQPHIPEDMWFGLCPLRSPLLWASRLISLPPGT